jgi:predicted dinucleotide-binding enzyme
MSTLGMIGSGLMSIEIARLALAAGVDVRLSNSRGPQSLTDLAAQLGDHALAVTVEEAAAADIVLLGLPLGRLGALDPAPLAGKTVIDLTNYYPHRDGRIAELDANTLTAGQFVQAHLPDAHSVRVFSNIAYRHIPQLARPLGAPDRSALPLAGDDPEANSTVAAIVRGLGFDAVDVGPLSGSWRFEPDTVAYLLPYASPTMKRMEDLRSTPGAPAGAAAIRALLDRAERTDQSTRAF